MAVTTRFTSVAEVRRALDARSQRHPGHSLGTDMDTNQDRCPVCAQPCSTFYPFGDADAIASCSTHGEFWGGQSLRAATTS